MTPLSLPSIRKHSTVQSGFRRRGRPPWLMLAGWLIALLWAMPALAQPQPQPEITVLVTEPTGFYQEAADSLSSSLGQAGWKVTVTTPAGGAAKPGSLAVAIGTPALKAALAQPTRPVLGLLVPRSTYQRVAAGKSSVSALYLDQPLARQLRLLAAALPRLKKIGVPLGPTSRDLEPELVSAANGSGIQVVSTLIDGSKDLYPALNEMAGTSQAFVLLPDPVVAQRNSLHNFFLHTYRLRRPVLAYSAPLAKSGAVLALYTTPAQVGEEAAAWIRQSWREGGFRLGEPRYPERFTIAVNRTVARSLDLDIPAEAELSRRLEAKP